jgi:hypothetical protein
MPTYADVFRRMLTYADEPGPRAGTQFTCFTRTKVRELMPTERTPAELTQSFTCFTRTKVQELTPTERTHSFTCFTRTKVQELTPTERTHSCYADVC